MVSKKFVLCVTADHSTPCQLASHSRDPVPVLIYTDGIKSDGISKFGEENCAKGSMKLKGQQLVPKLMKML